MSSICKQAYRVIMLTRCQLRYRSLLSMTYPVDCAKLLRWSCVKVCWQDIKKTDRSKQQRGHDSPCNNFKSPGSLSGCVPCCRGFLTSTSAPTSFSALSYVVSTAVLFFSRLRPALPSWTSSLEHPDPPLPNTHGFFTRSWSEITRSWEKSEELKQGKSVSNSLCIQVSLHTLVCRLCIIMGKYKFGLFLTAVWSLYYPMTLAEALPLPADVS